MSGCLVHEASPAYGCGDCDAMRRTGSPQADAELVHLRDLKGAAWSLSKALETCTGLPWKEIDGLRAALRACGEPSAPKAGLGEYECDLIDCTRPATVEMDDGRSLCASHAMTPRTSEARKGNST